MGFLYFSVWFIWRACCSSGVFPGIFYWTSCIGIWSCWGDLSRWARWGAEESCQVRRPHGFPWEMIFITYNSIPPFTCIQVLATSSCLSADDGRLVRSGHENFQQLGFRARAGFDRRRRLCGDVLFIFPRALIARKGPFCSSVDQSRTFLGLLFDVGIALASLWRFTVWFLIWCSLHNVFVL